MLVDVALPYRLPGTLTYELPDGTKVIPGCRLVVPLGRKNVIGCLVGATQTIPRASIKKVESVLEEETILNESQIKLLLWASSYYLTPVGEVLRHLIPSSLLKKKKIAQNRSRPVSQDEEFLTPQRDFLNDEQKGLLQEISLEEPKSYLLNGVTGSGKTEIYIRLTQEILKRKCQALILVPEIALTPQLIGRFQAALPVPVLPYHSGLTEAQRASIWLKVWKDEATVVVGTRSAIFLPFRRLQLIVVDEEHDPSYKQGERFCYNARDLALWRGREEKAVVLLGSATPSLESIHRAHTGKLKLLTLKNRPEGVTFPTTSLIDRRKKENDFLSTELTEAVRQALKKREQVLLFLNRRGFAPFLLCPRCGFVPRCVNCDISLTLHKSKGLLCHYCDRLEPVLPRCPSCRNGNLIPRGIGTERIEEEVKKIFPSAKIARLDRDTGRRTTDILSGLKKREVDILIGTQSISKGHDFPYVTLVGVIEADTALSLPDFRASERTFQILTQVAGRSGRGPHRGSVLIQTYYPDHPAILATRDHQIDQFYEQELTQRREHLYPPFCRLIRLILAGKNPTQVEKAAHLLADRLQKVCESRILGPAPCPLPKIRQKFRWHLLIKSREYTRLQSQLKPLLDDFQKNDLASGVRLLADVDPMEMM